jgi:hypothetical protein
MPSPLFPFPPPILLSPHHTEVASHGHLLPLSTPPLACISGARRRRQPSQSRFDLSAIFSSLNLKPLDPVGLGSPCALAAGGLCHWGRGRSPTSGARGPTPSPSYAGSAVTVAPCLSKGGLVRDESADAGVRLESA